MLFRSQSVNLRAYGQREPIVEYKKEGLRLFTELNRRMKHDIAQFLAHVEFNAQPQEPKIVTARVGAKVGRNEKVTIEKDGAEKQVKHKKLDEYLAAGWQVKE